MESLFNSRKKRQQMALVRVGSRLSLLGASGFRLLGMLQITVTSGDITDESPQPWFRQNPLSVLALDQTAHTL